MDKGLADVVRTERLRRAWSQEQLAERAGLSTRSISDIERGINRTPRPPTLRALSSVLDLPADLQRPLDTAEVHRPSPPTSTARSVDPFGGLLRRLRSAKNLTQRDLARRALISERAISDLERGITPTARRHTAGLLADALDLEGPARAEFLERAADAAPAGATAAAMVPGLIIELTPIIGRAQDVQRLADLVGTYRLVTLTGPGGVGKTRLATEVARVLAAGQAVVFASMIDAPARRAFHESLASALGVDVKGQGPGPLETALTTRLGAASLLVVDNVEHLPDAAPALRRLLDLCPDLHLLVTGRAPLRLRGEQVEVVDVLARETAADLFVAHAQAAGLANLGAADRAVIATICEKSGDLPLAIELAAGWVRVLPLAEIADRLDRPLDLLHSAGSDLPARQASIRATLEWSVNLLDPDHRVLFRRLAAFPAPWSLDLCTAVVGSGVDVLGGMRALVDANLVRVPAGGEQPRFRFVELVRDYASELLGQDPAEAAALADSHALAMVALGEQAAPMLIGTAQDQWLARLAQDHEHLMAAFDHLADHGRPEAVRLAGALWRYWYIHGHYRVGLDALERAIGLADESGAGADALAAVTYGAAVIAYLAGDVAMAEQRAAAAVGLYRSLADAHGEYSTLNLVAMIQQFRGELVAARATFDDAVRSADDAGAARAAATLRANLCVLIAEEGDLAAAMSTAEDAIVRFQALGDDRAVADLLGNLAVWAAAGGDFARARDLLHSVDVIYERSGDRPRQAEAQRALADVALAEGCFHEAGRLYARAREVAHDVGDRWGLAMALAGTAIVEVVAGSAEEGAAAAAEASDIADALEFREARVRARLAQGMAALVAGDRDGAGISIRAGLALCVPTDVAWIAIGAAALALTLEGDRARQFAADAIGLPAASGLVEPAVAAHLRRLGGFGEPVGGPGRMAAEVLADARR